jgi:hypothetical protein
MTLRDSFKRYSGCFGCVLFSQGRVDVFVVGAPTTGTTTVSFILLISSSLSLEKGEQGAGAISMVPYTGSDSAVTLVGDLGNKSEYATIQERRFGLCVAILPSRVMGSFVRCELFCWYLYIAFSHHDGVFG